MWEHSPGHNREPSSGTGPPGPLVCTNHLLHPRPDPAELPDEDGSLGTAALTYSRWRPCTPPRTTARWSTATRSAATSAVRFEAPVVGARTFWQALYDVEEGAVEVELLPTGRRRKSLYTQPLRFAL